MVIDDVKSYYCFKCLLYFFSPDREDLAFKNDDGQEEQMNTDEVTEDVDVDITNASNDELFTTIRMDIEDERSRTKDRFKAIVASSEATSEEKK